jgi:5-hydroxyisourate hydrolase
MSISTHVLDLVRGGPARGVAVTLDHLDGETWRTISSGETDNDGRIKDLVPWDGALAGVFRLTFETAPYLREAGNPGFYPYVPIVFQIEPGGGHYHVPLLLGPFGYSTYRGS